MGRMLVIDGALDVILGTLKGPWWSPGVAW